MDFKTTTTKKDVNWHKVQYLIMKKGSIHQEDIKL